LREPHLIAGLDDPFVAAYHQYQIDTAILYGATEASAKREMRSVLDFEIELAKISLADEGNRDFMSFFRFKTIFELQAAYPNISWLTYFNAFLPTKSQLTATDTVVVDAPSFFKQFNTLIANTDSRVIANYLMWRMTSASASYLSSDVRSIQFKYNKVIFGVKQEDPRWYTCLNHALRYFPHAFGSMYVRAHFNEDSKANVLDIFNNIKDEFKLNKIDWMDAATNAKALEKVESMVAQIGYFDHLLNDTLLTEYYVDFLTISPTQFYNSIFTLNVASTDRYYRRLRDPAFKNDDWENQIRPANVYALYSRPKNSIKFSAGILQGSYFTNEGPQYMNYGSIGLVIGHEITHGLSRYDLWGEALEQYLLRADCIIDQYNGYVEPLTGLNVNGENTETENIADNEGIKQSYRAYEKWVAANGKEKKLPGVNYSQRQLFWISAAQTWCNVYRKEEMINHIRTNKHSPGRFRVNGSMRNRPEFAADFDCAANTPMNPTSRCEVW